MRKEYIDMSLAKTTDMLAACLEKKYAVGAFNINSLDEPRALIENAEKAGSPLIVVEPGVIEPYVNFEDFVAVTKRAARDAKIPVSIHLSHGLSIEQCKKAIDAGFTSVMYDGSKLSFEENIANTKEVVDYGHERGCAVEGELGALGSSFVDVKETMTDPAKAREFVERTGVDILAVAIGNSHGFYKGTPHLDLDRLEEIKNAIDGLGCYLTLHGGSGISEEGFKGCIKRGIVKICIYTEMCDIGRGKVEAWLKENPKYTGNFDNCDMIKAMLEGFKESETHCCEMFESAGKNEVLPDLLTAVPENPLLGPEYPSLVALNPGFKDPGKFWDEF